MHGAVDLPGIGVKRFLPMSVQHIKELRKMKSVVTKFLTVAMLFSKSGNALAAVRYVDANGAGPAPPTPIGLPPPPPSSRRSMRPRRVTRSW